MAKKVSEGRKPTPRVQCPHCGDLRMVSNIERHIRNCPQNQEAHKRLRSFLCSLARRDGTGPTKQEYHWASRGMGLPHYDTLTKRHGSWNRVVEWAGLLPPDEDWQKKEQLNSPEGLVRIAEVREPGMEGMMCKEALRCVREWHPILKVYQPVGWQKVMVLR